jgi:hypothetical protein
MTSRKPIDLRLRQKIAAIAGAHPSDDSWQIASSNPEASQYVLFRDESKRECEDYGSLTNRVNDGLIVNLQEPSVRVPSLGIPYVFHIDEPLEPGVTITSEDEMMKATILDSHRATLQVDGETINVVFSATSGLSGIIVRVWLYNGVLYRSVRRRANFEGSRWEDSPLLSDIWEELHGPTKEDLFGDNTESPIVFVFIMRHPTLVVTYEDPFDTHDEGTTSTHGRGSVPFASPYGIFYVGSLTLYPLRGTPGDALESCPFNFVDRQGGIYNTHVAGRPTVVYEERVVDFEALGIRSPPELSTLEDINARLVDPRLERDLERLLIGPSGFVVLTASRVPDGRFLCLLKLTSPRYRHHQTLHPGNSPNLYHPFFCHAVAMYGKKPQDYTLFDKLVPADMRFISLKDLARLTDPERGYDYLRSATVPELREHSANAKEIAFLQTFMLALAPHLQIKCLDFVKRLIEDITLVCDWIGRMSKLKAKDMPKVSSRTAIVIGLVSVKGKPRPIVLDEKPAHIYIMVTEAKAWYKKQAKLAPPEPTPSPEEVAAKAASERRGELERARAYRRDRRAAISSRDTTLAAAK